VKKQRRVNRKFNGQEPNRRGVCVAKYCGRRSKEMRAQGLEPWTYGLKVIVIVHISAIKQRSLYLNDSIKGTI
tara:strand:+ start:1422 stop:1640 length:219 start_codon:yes stop_codon:yes gene_type:complete